MKLHESHAFGLASGSMKNLRPKRVEVLRLEKAHEILLALVEGEVAKVDNRAFILRFGEFALLLVRAAILGR